MDFVKLILIILVVIAHVVQCFKYGSEISFWNNNLFKAIYTFHMPLFIAISGYYSYHAIKKKNLFDFTSSKLKYILIPILCWGAIFTFFIVICDNLSPTRSLFSIIYNTAIRFWFVWAIFFFSFIMYILHKLKIDKLPVLILLGLAINLLPTIFIFRMDISKSFFIYYALAYWLASQDIIKYIYWCKKLFWVLLIPAIAFFIFWKPESESTYVYNLNNYFFYIIRILGSIICSIIILIILNYIYNKIKNFSFVQIAALRGQDTLALYFMQDFVFTMQIRFFSDKYVYPNASDFSLVLYSLVGCFLCFLIIQLIAKNNLLAFLLLGKKFKAFGYS